MPFGGGKSHFGGRASPVLPVAQSHHVKIESCFQWREIWAIFGRSIFTGVRCSIYVCLCGHFMIYRQNYRIHLHKTKGKPQKAMSLQYTS